MSERNAAWRKVNEVLDANGHQDTPEYRHDVPAPGMLGGFSALRGDSLRQTHQPKDSSCASE